MKLAAAWVVLFISFMSLYATNALAKETNKDKTDPFSNVEIYTLDNGLQVILSPSEQALLTKVRVDVGVGFHAENKDNYGVSHLLEHVLFRDEKLKDDMSYLQLILEKGGSANGVTESLATRYYGSIPHKNGEWLFKQITHLILNPEINDEYVEKEKKTIELERGRPDPIFLALGFSPADKLFPSYLKKSSFWESEFGVSFREKYSITHERLNTRRLTKEQVQKHYDDYYYPKNTKVLVSGKFDKSKIKELISKYWGSWDKVDGKPRPVYEKPKPKKRPYIRVATTTDTPYIHFGAVVSDVSIEDLEVLSAYTNFLSHRLMKELRNKRAQAYTVSTDSHTYKNYGYVGVSFETPKEYFDENYRLAKSYLETEAISGSISSELIAETKEFYLDRFRLWGTGADSMMWLGDQMLTNNEVFKDKRSPQQILTAMSDDEFRARLKKYFSPATRYLSLDKPPVFFHHDLKVFNFVFLISLFAWFRFRLTKPFANDEIKWVRKLRYPPLKLVELAAFALAFYFYIHLDFAIHIFMGTVAFAQETPLVQFISNWLQILAGVATIQFIISFIPRKLMVVGESLVIKSISYFSHSVPLCEVASVELLNWYSPKLLKRIWKIKWRFYYADPIPWRKGLLVDLKDGRSYFFSISSPEKAHDELQGILKQILKVNHLTSQGSHQALQTNTQGIL